MVRKHSWSQQRKAYRMEVVQLIVCIHIFLWHECQRFQSILWIMVSHYQYLTHRERRHVNLLMEHADFRWTSNRRILLRRSHSICQITLFCRKGQQSSHNLHLPLFSIPQTMPRCQSRRSACCFKVDTFLVSCTIGLHYPPQSDNRKRAKAPTLTSCPSNTIAPRLSRTKREKDPFAILNIPTTLVKQNYLPSFLSCWSCFFVLPTETTCLIHPGVFVVASKLAHGEYVNLVIPALTSIYEGLNKIQRPEILISWKPFFPSIMFMDG